MPLRKHTRTPPRFTFVTPEFEGNEIRWLKTHSDAARSHAAYWGGPAKRQRQANKESEAKKEDTPVHETITDKRSCRRNANLQFYCFAAQTIQRRGSTKLKNTKAISSKAEYDMPRYIAPNLSRRLSCLIDEEKLSDASTFNLTMFQFYSEAFIRRFVMVDNHDCPMILSSCLLLSYAHYMALTGCGTTTVLLELKSQVMHRLSAEMSLSHGLLSPRCLTAIVALGAPIVCLISRDMPRGLSIRGYIDATLEKNCLCNEDSAAIVQCSFEEQIVHRQALYELFLKTSANFRDADSLALLQYISNYIYIMSRSIALEAPNHLYTPLEDVEKLFPATDSSQQHAIPEDWMSPMTPQQANRTPVTHIEAQLLLLTSFTHKWLSTFLGVDNAILSLTDEILQERAVLYQRIKSFEPATEVNYSEAEAMYECCRRISLVLLAVAKEHIPIHAAVKHMEEKPNITKLLRMTDLPSLWGNHKGLLFWVAITVQFATARQCFPLLSTTLLAPLVQELSMSKVCAEVAVSSLKRLKIFENLCCGL
ncbi:hypothetical protein ACQKWADRAFT_324188 [Trichoderma austrokoningii]